MAQAFLHDPAPRGVGYPIIGKNSEAFAVADPVTVDSNGFLKVAEAGEKIHGYVIEDVTMASDNQTVAKVKPKYVYPSAVEMKYTADQAVTQTDIGAYADIGTATSGAIVLNFAAGANGQFYCIGFDPDDDGTTTTAVVIAAEPQELAFAQA